MSMGGGVVGEATIKIGADASSVPSDLRAAEKPANASGQRVAAALNRGLTNGLAKTANEIARAATAPLASRLSAGVNAAVKPVADRLRSGLSASAEAAGASLRKIIGPELANRFGNFLTQINQAETRSQALAKAGDTIRNGFVRAAGPLGQLVVGFRNADAAASAFSGKAGTLGGIARQLVGGFQNAQAAASSFSGVAGSIGGIVRRGFDIAVGGASRFASGVGAAFSKVTSVASSVFSKVVSTAQAAWSKLTSGARTAFAAVGRTMQSTLIAGARAAGVGAAAVIGAALVKGFGRLEAIDTATAKLTGLGNSAKDIESIMRSATNAVKGTAFGLGDAASAAASFAAAGVPISGMERTLSILASTSAVAGSSLGEMTTIFGKVAATGKLNGEVVQQLAERGIPVLSLLSDQLGVTAADVQKMVSKGQIDFETFQSAMEKSLGPAGVAIGQSFSGMLANTGAALGRLGAVAQKPIFESLKIVLPALIGFLDRLTAAMQPVADALLPRFQAGAEAIAAALSAVNFETTAAGAESFLSVLGPLAPLLGLAAGALGPLLSGLPLIGPLFAGITGPVGLFAGALVALLAVDPSTLTAGFASLASTIPGMITSLVSSFATLIPQIVTRLAASLPIFVQGIISLITAVIPAVVTALPMLVQAFVSLIPMLATALTTGLPTVITSILGLIPMLVTALVGAVPMLLTAGVQLLLALVQAIPVALPQILSAIVALIPQLITTLLTALPQILQTGIELFLQLVTAVVTAVPDIISAVLDLLPQLLETIVGMIPDLISTGVELFVSLVRALAQAIPDIITAVLSLLPQILQTLIGMIPTLIDGAVTLFVSLVEAIPIILPELIGALVGMAPSIIGAIIGLVPQLIQAGVDLISGLVQGLLNAAGRVGATLLKIAQDAVGSFMSFLGIASPSKLFKSFGKYIGQGLTVGLAGQKSEVTKSVKGLLGQVDKLYEGLRGDRGAALKKLNDYEDRLVKARGATRRKLLRQIAEQRQIISDADRILSRASRASIDAQIRAANTKLQKIASQRESIAKRLEVARDRLTDALQVRSDFVASISEGVFGQADAAGAKTAEKYIKTLTAQVETAKAFRATIDSLTKMGLSKSAIAELTEGFASTGNASAASAILAGGADSIQQINALRAQLEAQGKALGNSVGDTLYKAGIDAAKGLVKGLESESAALKKVADTLAKQLVTSIKKRLGIKSPSRVLAGVGVNAVLGYIKGVESLAGRAAAALGAIVPARTVSAIETSTASVLGDDVSRMSTPLRANGSTTTSTTTNTNKIEAPIHVHGADPYKTSALVADRLDEMAEEVGAA